MTYHIEEKISTFIRNYFPSYVRENGDMFVKFIETYYAWLESEGQTTQNTRKFLDFRNTNFAENDFFDFLRGEFMENFPKHLLVDERLLISRILDFYKSKGTKDAYKLLFRILYNEDITFYQPGVDILRASDGRWQRNAYIGVHLYANTSHDYVSNNVSSIYGATSEATAEIRKYDQVANNYNYYTKLYSNMFEGDFIKNEIVFDKSTNTAIGTVSNVIMYDPGNYEGTYGFLSSDKYLQDNYYYQEFSYEIRSTKSLNQYEKILKSLTHPIGTKLFGKVALSDETLFINLSYTNVVAVGNQVAGQLTFTVPMNMNLVYNETDTLLKLIDEKINNFDLGYDTLMRYTNSAGTPGFGRLKLSSSSVILDYANNTVIEYGTLPIQLIGSQKLFFGVNSHFTLELTNNTHIRIDDFSNVANTSRYVDTVYNNNIFSIKTNYPYANMANGIYYLI